MKRDYNRVEAIVMYNGKNAIDYVAVNCDMRPIYTKYYRSNRFKKTRYDNQGRIEMAYTSGGLCWVLNYDDNNKTVHFSDQDGYEYLEKYDNLNRLIYFEDSKGNIQRYIHTMVSGYYRIKFNKNDQNLNEIRYYDNDGNLIHFISTNINIEGIYKFNDNNELIWSKVIGNDETVETDYNPPDYFTPTKIKKFDEYYRR